MEINGIAHIQLTVNRFQECVAFYEKLLTFMGLKVIARGDEFFYCIGGRTGVALSPADPEHRDEGFVQRRVGLHHICFRARSREDVEAVHKLAEELGANVVHPPEQQDLFAPGYYSVLFEDPDGIRLEVNYVPGKGHFEPDSKGLGPDGLARFGND
jgi:catechol 2,3-dioxygenase-like lactoylglutathione lyase family enzyme